MMTRSYIQAFRSPKTSARAVRGARLLLSVAATAFVAALTLQAHAADAMHVRGTVLTVDGDAVTVRTNDDKLFALTLGDNWKIAGVVPATIADIRQGTFIGTANVEAADGNKALEVVVFPEAMRGTGEGNYGWDLQPESSMTNATVSAMVQGVEGQTVTLSYKGGQKTVTIPADTPIVTIAPGAGKADVKAGAKVFIAGVPGSDPAKLEKGFVAVGQNGATPPM